MTNNYIVTQGVDYLEYAVRDLEGASKMYEDMGFVCVGRRTESTSCSKLYAQGDIRLVLTASSAEKDPIYSFTRAHGDGVIDIAVRVDDAMQVWEQAKKLGAQSATVSVNTCTSAKGGQKSAGAIHVYGDVVHSLVSYNGGARLEDFFPEDQKQATPQKGQFLQTIDHITVNVEKGRVDYWADFYKRVFGFTEVRYFDIRTAKSGLFSRAMRSPNGRITMPLNEPTNDKSQIQEFLNIFHGPGVQHVAFHTPHIINTLDILRGKGFKFLTVPATYYETVPTRVPHVSESMAELQRLNILVDGSEKGYLLQIFSENMVGPLFYEYIQRKGDNGFGEGNFRALFEAIERDQERRGVI